MFKKEIHAYWPSFERVPEIYFSLSHKNWTTQVVKKVEDRKISRLNFDSPNLFGRLIDCSVTSFPGERFQSEIAVSTRVVKVGHKGDVPPEHET